MSGATLDQATERVRLARMAYAEVSADTSAGFQAVDAKGWRVQWEGTHDGLNALMRSKAASLAMLAVHGPEHETRCDAHRQVTHSHECAGIPVGYALIGGLCWKAKSDADR